MDTYELLNELEELIEKKSFKIFSKALVNVDDFFDLVGNIRSSLPEDVKSASRVTRDAEQIINNAKEQAEQIVDQSKAEAAKIVEDGRVEAARLVDANEITILANAKSKEIIISAEQEARVIKNGADDYAVEVLSELENFVSKVQGTIRHGRDKLNQKVDMGSGNE